MSSIITYHIYLTLTHVENKVKGAIDAFIKMSGVPMDACLSLGADSYRKPDIGMWKVCSYVVFVCVPFSICALYRISFSLQPDKFAYNTSSIYLLLLK